MAAHPDHAFEHPRVSARHIDIDPAWLDFGADDPLEPEDWINPCAACHDTPELRFSELRWAVHCACGQTGNPAQLAAIAVVNWNKSPLSRHPHYDTLPFFGLRGLSIPAARARLAPIREYLEEQKRRCEARIRARQPCGHRYFQRIRAYLAWAIYAQGLVREVEQQLLADAGRVPASPDRRGAGASR